MVQAQQCLTHPCPGGNYCYQGYCYPYNPAPPPPSPCFNNPYSYDCQNYCYYNPYDPYCPAPGPPYQDPCIRNPYAPQCDPCVRNPYGPYCNPCINNPYAAGCPDPFAGVGGNPLTGDNRFINNLNPFGIFGSSDASAGAGTAPPPADLGASLAAAPGDGGAPPAAAAPASRVRRAVEGLFGSGEE
ncbi:hypothetical protein PRZ48_006619 [Zasmidium cellare]|uniref:Uncharacterized protein n=1 Tax=Zasmidium cellare TaxID=395010 RepID=A0ABR0ENL3_ZASCE|nr:hypothetical protein PRZ48_006619 [Zasmidium cellare]